MTLLERYNNGDTTDVYADIAKLGSAAFTEEYFPDIEAVVAETMRRTAYNLDVIYAELKTTGYYFNHNARHSFEVPLTKPVIDVDTRLAQLEKVIAPFGYVPLSLKLFHKLVGSCNFGWDYHTNKNIPWRYADPIQIAPLDALIEEVTSEYWFEEMEEKRNTQGRVYLELSADYLHKDDVSGGLAYGIELTREPSVDGGLLNEEHQTSFINYLRIVFRNCGFGRTDHLDGVESFELFRESVQPKLKMI